MIGFLDLPGEIRNLIYDHPLMFQEPIVPWAKEQALPISLFYTNKTIYREFCSLFYSRITFNFTSHELGHEEHQCPARLTKQVTSFLDQIGQNAKYIESIKPDFPPQEIRDLGWEVELVDPLDSQWMIDDDEHDDDDEDVDDAKDDYDYYESYEDDEYGDEDDYYDYESHEDEDDEDEDDGSGDGSDGEE
ncbi:hypothetical protein EYB25_006084 [Talaromyces marneffei]|uniref:Uncharacterized protein n=1 Tax=Talaromyces marneffei (strain ATCC 18224 / CBS 334.59 / QM 7333) TaxID=441960 RepID=B6QJ00_TALMQ|nr:uncharacterized protein EYB26_006622 [Talaromyces marneffei]EEA23345.1 hypothetical protein PMAA_099330 [Talaromyces marneffei ATCC 18224]KAE8552190.1 hypothetical protein EYB25_006084 [Talaromyces marneffei]QGA18937.1 hypothetical protein EYB26_006622 [Talaromyces marneffei]